MQSKCKLFFFLPVLEMRIQVSILAPTMYPATSKLILINFPCRKKKRCVFILVYIHIAHTMGFTLQYIEQQVTSSGQQSAFF